MNWIKCVMSSRKPETNGITAKAAKRRPIPIPMYIYWNAVLDAVNESLGGSYTYYGYIAEVYRGTRINKAIDGVLDACIARVNADFESKGLCSKYSILPRT